MAYFPIPYRGPAPTDIEGILHCYVLQPTDSSPEITEKTPKYREVWKGPYDKAKDLAQETGIQLEELHRRMARQLSLKREYDVPDCPMVDDQQLVWRVTSIKIQELEAGDHALITIECEGYPDTSDPDELLSDPKQDVWSLTYQTITYSPYAFCKNEEPVHPPEDWSPGYDINGHPRADWTNTANRANIEQALTSQGYTFPTDKTTQKSNFLVFVPHEQNANDLTPLRKYINPVESAIAKKAILGTNALYHTPIVTHQTVERTTASKYANTLGEMLDHLDELPSDCPYEFEKNKWEWIKVADDCTQQKNKSDGVWENTFTRRQVWQAFLKGSCDINYYGNGKLAHTEKGITEGRWELQQM